jgi:hypothetical protein
MRQVSTKKFLPIFSAVLILSALCRPAEAGPVPGYTWFGEADDGESAPVGTAFGPLYIGVAFNGVPVGPGVIVAWTVQPAGNGAAATLPTSTTLTNGAGGTNIVPTANGIAGSYTVTALAPGGGILFVFSITNIAPAPASVAVVTGSPQSAAVGAAFPTALTVVVRDASSNPVPNIVVSFSAPGSGASATLSTPTAITNGSGDASIAATANHVLGSYSVTASVTGVATPATFSLANSVGAVSSVAAVSGSPQSAAEGVAFPAALTVVVKDTYNNPVPGATVTFFAPGSGASAALSALTAMTNANGEASITVTANHVSGSYFVTASVPGASTPATFALTNDVGLPSAFTAVSPLAQSAGLNALFATPLSVKVADASGNPVPGIPVIFSAPLSGPTAILPALSVTTNAAGIAAIYPVANGVYGSYSVTASTPGFQTIVFTLTNGASVPAIVTVDTGSPQTASLGAAFAVALEVSVTDAHGNSATGAVVRFSAPSVGASALLSLPAVTTDSSGHASITVTAGQTAGPYHVIASVSGVAAPAVFALTNSASPDISIGAIVSSADFRSGAAPGALLTIFGQSLAKNIGNNAPLPWPTVLGGVIVTVNGEPAPLYYVSPSQINFQLPSGVQPGPASVIVSHDSADSPPYALEVSALAPALFVSATNRAAALDTGYIVNSDSHPAAPGAVLLLYATGQGSWIPPYPAASQPPRAPFRS